MQLEQPKPKRIRIEIKEVEYAGDGKTGHKVVKSKSMTVYDSSVDELESVIKKAIEQNEVKDISNAIAAAQKHFNKALKKKK